MKWLASAACLLPLIICRAEPPKNSAWQVEAKPVLVPGDVGSWDDFALRDVAVLRVENKWLMIYKGIALSEDGRTCGLGLASSSDGVTWEKPLDEAIVPVDPNTDVLSPALVRWNGAYLAAYVVQPLRDSADDTEPDPRVEFASSEGGRVWQPQTNAGFAIKIPDSIYLRIGFYADGGMLHLWWLGSDADRKAVLCHSISRDGLTWSHPNMQPADKIDSRDMVGARVYPSGNFFLLVYLARVSVNEVHVVTKISHDAITWKEGGPPEFVLPDPRNIAMPEMVFSAEGARLYYSETRFLKRDDRINSPNSGAILRMAFCPKSAYVR